MQHHQETALKLRSTSVVLHVGLDLTFLQDPSPAVVTRMVTATDWTEPGAGHGHYAAPHRPPLDAERAAVNYSFRMSGRTCAALLVTHSISEAAILYYDLKLLSNGSNQSRLLCCILEATCLNAARKVYGTLHLSHPFIHRWFPGNSRKKKKDSRKKTLAKHCLLFESGISV